MIILYFSNFYIRKLSTSHFPACFCPSLPFGTPSAGRDAGGRAILLGGPHSVRLANSSRWLIGSKAAAQLRREKRQSWNTMLALSIVRAFYVLRWTKLSHCAAAFRSGMKRHRAANYLWSWRGVQLAHIINWNQALHFKYDLENEWKWRLLP